MTAEEEETDDTTQGEWGAGASFEAASAPERAGRLQQHACRCTCAGWLTRLCTSSPPLPSAGPALRGPPGGAKGGLSAPLSAQPF